MKKWIKDGWSLFAIIIIVVITIFYFNFYGYSEKVYKSLSVIAQVIGAILILYSINENIKIIDNKSMGYFINEWIKSFPYSKKSVQVKPEKSRLTISGGKVTVFVENNFETIEKKVEFLLNEYKNIHSRIEENDSKVNERITQESEKINQKINQNHDVVEKISLKISEIYGSLNIPIFGVLLMIYATIIGAIPDFMK